MFRFSTITIGCKVNQYETQAIIALLRRKGLRETNDPSKPSDLVIINTCCVTSSASAKSRRAIRRIVRKNPDADIFILGCYATSIGPALRQVAIQAGATDKIHVFGHQDNIADCLQQYLSSVSDPGRAKKQRPRPTGPVGYEKSMRECLSQHPAKDRPNPAFIGTDRNPDVKKNYAGVDMPAIEIFTGHQRAFVKVQDGCDAFCSYCIIPHLRSRLSSRPADRIVSEASNLIANGHKEIVLCGVFLGAYGRATAVRRRWSGPSGLPKLLRRIAGLPGLWSVRLSSLEPGDVTDELLAVFRQCPTVAPHLHLPLQSGCDRILKRMNRQYGREQFFEAVRRVRESINEAAITTDVVVGFPGETEEDFAETLAAARGVGFSRIHIFGFSARSGTAAWQWRKEAAHPTIVKARCAELAAVERELAEKFRRQFIGQTVEALVETPNTKTPPGCARGLTARYIEVTFPKDGREALAGKVVRLRIERLSNGGLAGTLAEDQ